MIDNLLVHIFRDVPHVGQVVLLFFLQTKCHGEVFYLVRLVVCRLSFLGFLLVWENCGLDVAAFKFYEFFGVGAFPFPIKTRSLQSLLKIHKQPIGLLLLLHPLLLKLQCSPLGPLHILKIGGRELLDEFWQLRVDLLVDKLERHFFFLFFFFVV